VQRKAARNKSFVIMVAVEESGRYFLDIYAPLSGRVVRRPLLFLSFQGSERVAFVIFKGLSRTK
jgi:hypothetical protein